MAKPQVSTKGMQLEEFIRLFEDPDPWAVSYQTWDSRVNAYGVPDRWYLLTDPELRSMLLDDLIKEMGPLPEHTPPEEDESQHGGVDEFTTRVAKVLRFRRLSAGYSLRQVARGTNLHPSVLCRIEKGTRDITLGELRRVTQFLGFPIEMVVQKARMRPELAEND